MSDEGIFWARSRRHKFGYEAMYHALRPLKYSGHEWNHYVTRLCEGGTIRNKDNLLPGTPREEFRCPYCNEMLVAIVRRRLKGKET